LGKFWSVLQWKMLVYFRDIWSLFGPFHIGFLWTFGTFCCDLVHFPPVWYIVPRKIWQPCNQASSTTQAEPAWAQPFSTILGTTPVNHQLCK
jgi:hypothetical protein